MKPALSLGALGMTLLLGSGCGASPPPPQGSPPAVAPASPGDLITSPPPLTRGEAQDEPETCDPGLCPEEQATPPPFAPMSSVSPEELASLTTTYRWVALTEETFTAYYKRYPTADRLEEGSYKLRRYKAYLEQAYGALKQAPPTAQEAAPAAWRAYQAAQGATTREEAHSKALLLLEQAEKAVGEAEAHLTAQDTPAVAVTNVARGLKNTRISMDTTPATPPASPRG